MIIDKINTHKSNSYNTLCNCKAFSALKKNLLLLEDKTYNVHVVKSNNYTIYNKTKAINLISN